MNLANAGFVQGAVRPQRASATLGSERLADVAVSQVHATGLDEDC